MVKNNRLACKTKACLHMLTNAFMMKCTKIHVRITMQKNMHTCRISVKMHTCKLMRENKCKLHIL